MPGRRRPIVVSDEVVVAGASTTSTGGPPFCWQAMEVDGGAFGCMLPAGHSGPHILPPRGKRRVAAAAAPETPPAKRASGSPEPSGASKATSGAHRANDEAVNRFIESYDRETYRRPETPASRGPGAAFAELRHPFPVLIDPVLLEE